MMKPSTSRGNGLMTREACVLLAHPIPSHPSFLMISKLWCSFCELHLLHQRQECLDCQSRCPAHHLAERWTQDPGLLPEFASKEKLCEDRVNTIHPWGLSGIMVWFPARWIFDFLFFLRLVCVLIPIFPLICMLSHIFPKLFIALLK